jgi:hypothetical protein
MAMLSPDTVNLVGHSMLVRQMCGLLVRKGLVTQAEAAAVFTSAAEEVRMGTEDRAPTDAALGEMVATSYEQQAHWLLGYSGTL